MSDSKKRRSALRENRSRRDQLAPETIDRVQNQEGDESRIVGQQLLISPGWSHYIITAPLSPKAHVVVSKHLRHLADQDASFSPFHSSALNIAIMDLGVIPESRGIRLEHAMESALRSHASLKLQATRFRVSHAMAPHGEPIDGEPALLWLEFRDRLGVIGSIYSDLANHLKGLCPELGSAAPREWAEQKKFIDEFSVVLCGVISVYKSGVYEQVFSGSAWINELNLQKRPSHFNPNRGYESVWRFALPLETPLLTEQEEAELLPQTIIKQKTRLEYPLEGQDLVRLKALEALLEELENDRTLIKTNRSSRRRSNRRKPRGRSSTSDS